MVSLLRLSTIAAAALHLVTHSLAGALPPRDLVAELLAPVVDLGNTPPPDLLWTPNPSAECAGVNAGELQCCRGSLAGDLPIVVFLAKVYGFELNPNDVNGILCDSELDECPGVKLCCQVTALNPLLSLYCQDYSS